MNQLAFSAKYLQHFTNPVGVGEIIAPDLSAQVEHEGGGCFDKIDLQLSVSKEKIADVKFKARACSGTIAACSALVTILSGKTLNDALTINEEALIAELDGIPEKKRHSVELAVEALHRALEGGNPLGKV